MATQEWWYCCRCRLTSAETQEKPALTIREFWPALDISGERDLTLCQKCCRDLATWVLTTGD